MNRLNYVLPDFTRIIWVSQEAKEIWASKISKISQSFLDIEKKSALLKKRIAYLHSMHGFHFLDEQMNIERNYEDISLIALSKIKRTEFYSNTQVSADITDKNYDVRCVLIQNEYKKKFLDAWQNNDNKTIGKLLGYPSCCIDFFEKYWVEENYIDTTYPMSLSGTVGPKECNILLRWLGIRAVSHLPCSFNCKETYNRAISNIDLGRSLGYNEEMSWLEEMLDWPVQWSALHGIAEIKTPILKISSRTDATSDLVTVNRSGYSYPNEGASGNSFPYINKAKKSITNTQSFSRSIMLEKSWEDNGFSTIEGMIHSHNILLECIDKANIDLESVIDFGCGNAELLKRISQKYSCEIFGVELDKSRYDRIKYNTTQNENFYNENMFEKESQYKKRTYDLAIVMPGRFEENTQEAHNFVSWLSSNVKHVLFYGYGDWISRLFNNSEQEPVRTMKKLSLEFKEISKSQSNHVSCFLGSLNQKQKEVAFNIL